MNDLLRFHPTYRETVHLDDSVSCMEQTWNRRFSWLKLWPREKVSRPGRSRQQLTASISQAAVNHTCDENFPGDLVSLYRCSLEQREEKKNPVELKLKHTSDTHLWFAMEMEEEEEINHRNKWMWQASWEGKMKGGDGKKAKNERQYHCRCLQDQIPLKGTKSWFFKKPSHVSDHPSSLFWNSAGIWFPVGVPCWPGHRQAAGSLRIGRCILGTGGGEGWTRTRGWVRERSSCWSSGSSWQVLSLWLTRIWLRESARTDCRWSTVRVRRSNTWQLSCTVSDKRSVVAAILSPRTSMFLMLLSMELAANCTVALSSSKLACLVSCTQAAVWCCCLGLEGAVWAWEDPRGVAVRRKRAALE